jgi:hypothetical protein
VVPGYAFVSLKIFECAVSVVGVYVPLTDVARESTMEASVSSARFQVRLTIVSEPGPVPTLHRKLVGVPGWMVALGAGAVDPDGAALTFVRKKAAGVTAPETEAAT